MMKKMIMILGLLMVGLGLVGCNESLPEGDRVFTIEELSDYDGLEGRMAYVAVDGVVYDVTTAENWNNGVHNGQRLAGTDASTIILSSPHGKSVLSGLPIVGRLE